MNSPPINSADARKQGYMPLTNEYNLPDEQPMLDNVLRDMRAGNIDHVIVGGKRMQEVWRKPNNLCFAHSRRIAETVTA